MFKCLHSVLMWRYTNIPSVVEEAGKKDKRSSLSQICLEGLLRILTTCQQRYPDKMVQLLSTMGEMYIVIDSFLTFVAENR